MTMTPETTTTTGPKPGETPQAFAKRTNIFLNEPAPPAPEAKVPEGRQQPGESAADYAERVGVTLNAEPEEPEVPDLVGEVLRALEAPGHVTADDLIELVASSPRQCAPAMRALRLQESSSDGGLHTGGPRTLRSAGMIAANALDAYDAAAVALGVELKKVNDDPELSEAGKAKRRQQIHQRFAEDKEPAQLFARADDLLAAREAKLEGELDSIFAAPPPPTVYEQLLQEQRVGNALYVAKATGNDAKVADVVLRSAAAGDAVLAAGTMRLLSVVAVDKLQVQFAAKALGQQMAALRRRQVLANPKALAVGVELAEVRRVRTGLRSLQGYIRDNPTEIGLARQLHEKIFARLKA